ncbi:5-hydroxytryptamine receptor 1F-like [Pomacea canaliculata]|uniref:5-hydroxytryptamine receptor 1F-like n=1 Tax=Pomacea canaliculata TaxID=400727 RepID=UPI000D736FDC|nr:5-hydroxytryptamine receptor 1F-like [Pomacea canaliculata]XP_025101402.1 5-hydroxytryptamine receptor 1F-like [Pomacea canaliculata]
MNSTTHPDELNASRASSSEDAVEKLNSELFQKLLPSTIIFTVLICAGLPGNLLVLLVYLKKFKSSATRVFVVAMAVCDFSASLLTIPLAIVYFRLMYTISGPTFCPAMYFSLSFPIVVSGCILLCVSLDRRRRVCQPFRRQLSPRQATFILMFPLGLGVLATLPFAPFHDGIEFTTSTGLTVRKCSFRQEYPGYIFRQIQGGVLVVYATVGLVVLVIAYSRILRRLRFLSQKKRDRLARAVRGVAPQQTAGNKEAAILGPRDQGNDYKRSDCKECQEKCKPCDRCEKYSSPEGVGGQQQSPESLSSKTTLMMFVLTVTNAVCLLPYLILAQFHETFYEPHTSAWILNLATTCRYLPTLRSTITPVIYLYFNPKFRMDLRKVLTKT